jgi:hypothetical protein
MVERLEGLDRAERVIYIAMTLVTTLALVRLASRRT